MLKTLLNRALIFCLLVFYWCGKVDSQTVYNWQDFVENYLTEDIENISNETVMEVFYDIHRQPFDVNTVEKEQLEMLPFLSDNMVENILSYQYQYGPLKSLDELQLVKDMDYETFQYLCLFLVVGEKSTPSNFPSLKKLLKYGKRTLVFQTDHPLYWKESYKRHAPEVLEKNPNKEYLGRRFSTSLRLDWSYTDKISVGLTADKDAGEPFFTFTDKNKGFDFYSYYLIMNDFNKWLKTLAIGQYRLGFGQGLIMNTDFSMGKSTLFTSTGLRSHSIRKHASLSEYNYFRGIAGTFRISDYLQGTAFYSHVDKDANISDNGLITSWKTDGLHRTPLEISKNKNTVNQTAGGNLSYSYKHYHVGLTGVYNYFNRLFKVNDRGYRKYYPKDYRQWNLSTDYRLHYKQHSLQGEVAVSHEKALATINTLRLGIVENWQLIFLQRFYSYKFNAMYGRSFSEGSLVKNESGLLGGFKFTPSYKFNVEAYVDVFYFPWETYTALPGSRGYELYGQGFYAFSEQTSVRLRYRFKSKEQTYSPKDEKSSEMLKPYNKHSLRFQMDASKYGIAFRTTLNGVFVKFMNESSKGFLVSQSVRLPELLKRFDIQFNGHYFRTDNYATRLSAYESGLLYQFGFTSFYGHGYRFSTSLRYKPLTSLHFIAKFGHTQYFDRRYIGTGLEMSEGNNRENISLQMYYKF